MLLKSVLETLLLSVLIQFEILAKILSKITFLSFVNLFPFIEIGLFNFIWLNDWLNSL
jgi:hypothetical protein